MVHVTVLDRYSHCGFAACTSSNAVKIAKTRKAFVHPQIYDPLSYTQKQKQHELKLTARILPQYRANTYSKFDFGSSCQVDNITQDLTVYFTITASSRQ